MGRFESETVWPLKFPDGGRNADFLQVVGDPRRASAFGVTLVVCTVFMPATSQARGSADSLLF